MEKKRQAGLDVIRSLAIFFVMLLHMFAFSGALQNLHARTWCVSVALRYLSSTGVLLFLLLTGCLQRGRKADKRHYTSIIPVLASYFTIAAIEAFSGGNEEPFAAVVRIFDFTVGYSWYVEMYIGLFLLIPFFNALFGALNRNRQKLLIASLSFLTFCPALMRGIPVKDTYLTILPDYFMNLYVVAVYFIGVYIGTYRPRPNRLLCGGTAAAVLIAEVAACRLSSAEHYAWWLFNHGGALTHVVVAVCLFLLLYDAKISSRVLSFVSREISACSFEMYLLSFLTDGFFYTKSDLPKGVLLPLDFAAVYLLARLLRLLLAPPCRLLRKYLLREEPPPTAKCRFRAAFGSCTEGFRRGRLFGCRPARPKMNPVCCTL